MAHQGGCWWHMPYSEIVGCIDTCCGEATAHIHITTTDSYCKDTWVRTTSHTATESSPTAPVPPGYVVCRHPSCCVEVPTRVHIAATDAYCIDMGTARTITHTATEGRPIAAVPFGYGVCGHPTCRKEESTHIHVGATDGYCVDQANIQTATEG